MSLTPEWRGRLDHCKNLLPKLFFTSLGDVPLSGFVTKEQLTPAAALKRAFKPMATGTKWGAKWEYAWLRGAVRLPQDAAGQRIVLRTNDTSGYFGEGRVLVNGREAGGRDWAHREITLTTAAKAGQRFDVLLEVYGGHGDTPCGGGPALHGVPTVPEPPAQQRALGTVQFGIWEEDCFQAWLDLQTLYELRDLLDQNSLRVSEIDAALREFTCLVDLELPRPALRASVAAGRARLAPLLACRNGATAPALYAFGHSHIDVAWLWPLQETERKCARTFATQLALMEQYPEYRFLQSQPHLYRMTQRHYPELYARIKAAAKRGQWLAEGGMWVEADTNVTGGESLIRQFIHGKRFYRDEFGVTCELMWLPDVFGYSGAMPQIMAGCGIKYFSTQKIFWAYNGGDIFPYNTFWWEGIDGTRVLAHFHNDYNSMTNPKLLAQRWNERVQKDGLRARLVPFGHGDGGGGPTREHLEFVRRQADLEGQPKVRYATTSEFFREECERRTDWPAYVGELYFQNHRGTYTTQARTKRGNRLCELALREAEMWGVAAAARAGYAVPFDELDEAWKGVLLNQFHDIIPGSSIQRVYEEAEALHTQVLATARATAAAAAKKLLRRQADAVTAFNSLAWERTALVPLPAGFAGAALDGTALPVQQLGDTLYAEAPLPSCGWATLTRAAPGAVANALSATATSLENECLRLTLNDCGEVASCVDKATGRELAAAPLNSLRLYRDEPRWFDAWDIDSTYKALPVPLTEKAKIEVVAAGPLVAVLRVTRTISTSQVTQDIVLRRGSRRVEFRTRVDWHEKHRLLKVNFPTAIHANEAIHEVQFGHLRRPNHASRPFDGDRYEVCNQKWTALAEEHRGVAVLNDCKYGVNVEGGSINLTLLRATQAPDMNADQGVQEFTYALYAWAGSFYESGLVREAYELNVPAMAQPGAGGSASLFTVDAPNVILETVKPAEDRSGDVVVRLYEAKHTATRATLRTALPVKAALAVDMLEEGNAKVAVADGAIALDFRPFEIKTLRLKLRR